jgi:hypothetical protein
MRKDGAAVVLTPQKRSSAAIEDCIPNALFNSGGFKSIIEAQPRRAGAKARVFLELSRHG